MIVHRVQTNLDESKRACKGVPGTPLLSAADIVLKRQPLHPKGVNPSLKHTGLGLQRARHVPASLGFTATRYWKVPRCRVNLSPCYMPLQVKRTPTDWANLVSLLDGVETGMGDLRLERRMHDECEFRNALPTQLPARPSRRWDWIKTRPSHQRSVNKCKRFLRPF